MRQISEEIPASIVYEVEDSYPVAVFASHLGFLKKALKANVFGEKVLAFGFRGEKPRYF